MKLKELAIEGSHLNTRRTLQLGRFSDGLTIVYGESGSGKSTVRRFVRDQILARVGGSNTPSANPLQGRISFFNGSQEVQLGTGASVVAGNSNAWPHLNSELYDLVYNVSFRETKTNLGRLGAVLRTQLGVPTGPGAAGDESEYMNWQRQTEQLNQQLESLNYKISSLNEQKNEYARQLESARLSRQSQVAEVESRIGQINHRINELRATGSNSQLGAIDLEITQLRSLINSAPQQVVHQAPQQSFLGHESLYKRLDDIDDQIRQWRQIQADIQNQRVRLRDEMLIWNELNLDSPEHPYHDARSILIDLESKVEETQRNANMWAEADIERVDATQLAQSLDQICKAMRNDLHGICNELSQQYKHIRHKAAALELKQLRRYYTQIGENIDRLLGQRQIVIREIRDVDPAGADVIIAADSNFCQYASREGHLAARRRFVGEFAQAVVRPTYQAPDFSAQHARLAMLDQQRNQIIGSQSQFEHELNSLNSQLAELSRQRDAIAAQFGFADSEAKIQTIGRELQTAEIESNNLRRQLEELRQFVPSQPNSLIQRACGILEQLSDGDLTQVFLSQPTAGPITAQAGEVQVRDRVGKVFNASSIDTGLQDQVYLSLILAAAEQLQHSQNDGLPLVIDDAFSRIPPERVTQTLQLLNDHGVAGKQIIALTQHRYLSDRIAGVAQLELLATRMELAPPLPASPIAVPERRSSPLPYVVTPAVPYTAPRQKNHWEAAAPVTSLVSANALPNALPYPLSKYPRSDEQQTQDRSYTVAYPGTNSGISVSRSNSSQRPLAAPLEVQMFADNLGYTVSITEETLLRKVGFFDAQQIRNLDTNGLATVGDLLALSSPESESLGIHREQLLRWQDQLVLLSTIPGMRNKDARILVACGVTEPEQLDTLHPKQLFERVERFLGTTEGRRFAANSEPISMDHISGWYRALDATRSSWQNRRLRGDALTRNASMGPSRTGQRGGGRTSNSSRSSSRQRSTSDRGPRGSFTETRSNFSETRREPRESRSARSEYRSSRPEPRSSRSEPGSTDSYSPSTRSEPRSNRLESRRERSSHDFESNQRSERRPRVYSRDRAEREESERNRTRVDRETTNQRRSRRSPSRTQRESVGRESAGFSQSRDPRVVVREPRDTRVEVREPRDSRVIVREPRDTRVDVREPRDARTPRINTPATERKVVPRVAPVNLVDSGERSAEVRSTKTRRSKSAKSNSGNVKLKFYLDLNDHIEAAPSIGPKSAERFEKIGIHTVADFLKQTAESVSTKLNYKRLTAKVILDWQNHARLVCRIPNLRGHDAQLLVACGLTDPEVIATMRPETLFATIGPFSETKEGLKIIRNGKKPDLAEITDWINWAGHTRSLKAA